MTFRATFFLVSVLALVSCQQRTEVSTTTGAIRIECDETVEPLIRVIADDFMRTYPASEVTVVPTSLQAAIVDFINDSTQMIATDRPLSDKEAAISKEAGFEYRSYHIAIDAVAVIVNKANPVAELRVSELDSILTGLIYRWRPWGGKLLPIQLALGTEHSATTQIVQDSLMGGKGFSSAAMFFGTTAEILDFVGKNENALGLVGLAWLHGREDEFTVVALGDPNHPPDPSEPPGVFYTPHQAHVYRGYYPITTKVYFYNRELLKTVGLGLIAYTNNIQGQKLVQSYGLVPATIPVRLVETTSTQVTAQ